MGYIYPVSVLIIAELSRDVAITYWDSDRSTEEKMIKFLKSFSSKVISGCK